MQAKGKQEAAPRPPTSCSESQMETLHVSGGIHLILAELDAYFVVHAVVFVHPELFVHPENQTKIIHLVYAIFKQKQP